MKERNIDLIASLESKRDDCSFKEKESKMQRTQIESQLAKLYCPYEIGQILEDDLGRQAKLSRIEYNHKGYIIFGVLAIKNGFSDYVRRLYYQDKWLEVGVKREEKIIPKESDFAY